MRTIIIICLSLLLGLASSAVAQEFITDVNGAPLIGPYSPNSACDAQLAVLDNYCGAGNGLPPIPDTNHKYFFVRHVPFLIPGMQQVVCVSGTSVCAAPAPTPTP